ncbi:MAG: hypothetical protein ABI591_08170 [Kofleriaceae bacterium]
MTEVDVVATLGYACHTVGPAKLPPDERSEAAELRLRTNPSLTSRESLPYGLARSNVE